MMTTGGNLSMAQPPRVAQIRGATEGGTKMDRKPMTLADSVRDMLGLNGKKGRRKYKELYEREIAARVEEWKEFEDSKRLIDSAVQLAAQQTLILKKLMAETKKVLHQPGENDDL
jgi:hypothetical protein